MIATELKNKIIKGYLINKEEALSLINEDLEVLCKCADELTRHFCKDEFDLCSIVNGKSGRCTENCKYCAQSAHYCTNVEEYDLLDYKDIESLGKYNYSKGIPRYSIVTSGRRLSKDEIDKICEIYEKLSETKIYLCASHGLLEYEDFIKLKNAGVKRYHNNLETSRRYFPNVCTTHTYDDKIKTIKAAQKAGLEVCCGGIMGLGETMEDRIDMALDIRELGIRSMPINFLNPIPNTPFEHLEPLKEDEFRRIVAIFRFINPTAVIRLAGGRGLLVDKGRSVFQSGANGSISGDMLTTSGVTIDSDLKMIEELNYCVKKL